MRSLGAFLIPCLEGERRSGFAAQPAKIYGSGHYQAALTGELYNTSNLLDKAHPSFLDSPRKVHLSCSRYPDGSCQMDLPQPGPCHPLSKALKRLQIGNYLNIMRSSRWVGIRVLLAEIFKFFFQTKFSLQASLETLPGITPNTQVFGAPELELPRRALQTDQTL